MNLGNISIQIAQDALSVQLTLRASRSGEPPTFSEVQSALTAAGIINGVHWDDIRAALQQMSDEGLTSKQLLAARGIGPRAAVREMLVFHPKIRERFPELAPDNLGPPPRDTDFADPEPDKKIDYREKQTFFVVRKDQILAIRRPARPGEFGTNVLGDMVPFETIEYPQPEPGENTVERDGKVYAEVDGKFSFSKDHFKVDTVLELSGEVGYATGHIRFPAHAILRGRIQDRFSVWIGGNLESSVTVDCWDVFAAGNMTCTEGIIGRGDAHLRVRGDLSAKFIENCNAEILGNIRLIVGSLNANIHCNKSLRAPERGRLVGGFCMVRETLEVQTLGNDAELRTELVMGIDFVAQRKLDSLRLDMLKIGKQIGNLQEEIAKNPSPGLQDRLEALRKLQQEVNEHTVELLPQVDLNPDAVIVVHGTIYPGVLVHFGNQHYEVTRRTSRSKIYFSQEKGSPVCEPL